MVFFEIGSISIFGRTFCDSFLELLAAHAQLHLEKTSHL